jgi:DNA invertase Pin-like site-specific DNA recombinase
MSNNKKYNINLILDKSDEIIEIQIIFNILRVKLMKIGYARVSTKHQGESLDQQIKLLKKSGCSEVYSEVISGANSKRPELTKVLELLKSNDTLIITSIDRLGRSLKDLISIVSHLQENSVNFFSIKEQMDTSTDTGMLMFNMMGSIAEFERKLINRRIYDGVQRAHELGKYKGRTYSVDKDIRKEYVQMMQSGKYTIAYLAKMAKVSRQTLYNWKADLQ